jgi:hypothetical protein
MEEPIRKDRQHFLALPAFHDSLTAINKDSALSIAGFADQRHALEDIHIPFYAAKDIVMSNSADEPRADDQGSAAGSGKAAQTAAQNSDSRALVPSGRLLAAMLLMAAGSTIVSWQLVERFYKTFELPASVTSGLGSTLTPAQRAAIEAALPARDIKNLSLTVGIFGAATGLLFGIGTGLVRWTKPAIMAGILGGLLSGAVAGALGGTAEYFVENRMRSLTIFTGEHRVILGHLTGWAIAGLGIGAGASISSRCRQTIVRCMVAGFAGGLIGGALYVPLVTILVPEIDSEQLIPNAPTGRLIWVALPTIIMGLGIWRILGARRGAKVVATGHG